MTREEKIRYFLAVIGSVMPVLAGAILYSKLPDVIATHWDAQGVPNGYQSKFVGVIVFPMLLTLLTIVMPLLMRVDPKYKNMNEKLRTLVIWIVPIVSIVCEGVTIAYGMDMNVPVPMICCSLIGVIFILVGNFLPKTKQSYTMGIKLPWTLDSEENWNKTHRMAGFIWVIGGFTILLCGFLPIRVEVFTVCTVIMVLAPILYSFWYYRKETKTK